MTDPSPSACLYAMKLVVDPADRSRIAGRIEHIVTGRRFDFSDGDELLRVLSREQAEGYPNATAVPSPSHR